MGAGGGAAFGHYGGLGGKGPSGKSQYAIDLDDLYGEGWEARTLKTMHDELKDRGIDPKIGDDGYQVIPTPRLVGDRVSLGMLCALFAFLGLCACWASWE